MERDFSCEFCNKTYKYASGLYRHHKKCEKKITQEVSKNIDNSDLMLLLIKSTENNTKFCEKLCELENKQQNAVNLNSNIKLNSNSHTHSNIESYLETIRKQKPNASPTRMIKILIQSILQPI